METSEGFVPIAVGARRAEATRIEREARTALNGYRTLSVANLRLLRDAIPTMTDLGKSVRDVMTRIVNEELQERKR